MMDNLSQLPLLRDEIFDKAIDQKLDQYKKKYGKALKCLAE